MAVTKVLVPTAQPESIEQTAHATVALTTNCTVYTPVPDCECIHGIQNVLSLPALPEALISRESCTHKGQSLTCVVGVGWLH